MNSKLDAVLTLFAAGCDRGVITVSQIDSGPPPDLVGLPNIDLAPMPDLAGTCPTPKSAPGYVLEMSAVGVTVCRKDDPGGTPTYVTVADLTKVEIRSVSGVVVTPRPDKGPFGGPDPTVTRLGIAQLQDVANALWPMKVFQIFDAQFYNPLNNPTQLAFGVKQEGVVFSDGAATLQEFVGQKMVMQISNAGHAVQIIEFDESSPAAAKTQWAGIVANAVVDTAVIGLDPAADKSPNSSVGRTFVGSDGIRVYVIIAPHSIQADVDKTLHDFGAVETMMLGGGSSAQSMLQGNALLNTGVLIPHALAVVSK